VSASTARLQAAAALQGAANEEDAGNAELAFAVDLPPLGCVRLTTLHTILQYDFSLLPQETAAGRPPMERTPGPKNWLSQPNCHRSGASHDSKRHSTADLPMPGCSDCRDAISNAHSVRRWAVFDVWPAKKGAAGAALESQPRLADRLSGAVPAAAAAASPQLDLRNGGIVRLRKDSLATALNVSMRWYNSSDGADGAVASGAYIFRCDI